MNDSFWDYEWFEKLPSACPPADARVPHEETFFRVSNHNPASADDFLSERARRPRRVLECDECEARAVSLWDSLEHLNASIGGLNAFRGKPRIAITLTPDSGVVKCTFKKHHISWWRAKSFDVLAHLSDSSYLDGQGESN